MNIFSTVKNNGMNIRLKKEFSIKYPGNTWQSLNNKTKEAIKDNLTYLKLASYSAIMREKLIFDTRKPILKSMIDRCTREDFIRFAYEDDTDPNRLTKNFADASFSFREGQSPSVAEGSDYEDGAVLSISFGKDSLLSYALLKELGIKRKLVFFEDTWDVELMHKKNIMSAFQKEFKEEVNVVIDEVDNLDTDPLLKNIKSKGVYGSNAMNGYMLMCLPFNFKSRLRQVVFGNEQNFNDKFDDTKGRKGFFSYEQSSVGMGVQNRMLAKFTDNNVKLHSYVEPLREPAELKVLFNRYPSVAKYQMTCAHPEVEDKKNRWCQACSDCAGIFDYLWSIGVNPRIVGFNKNLFDKKYQKLHVLFDEKQDIIYNKTIRDDMLYCFLKAYKRGAKGYLIDKFRKEYYCEAKEREEEIFKKIFKIYPSKSLTQKQYSEVKSIYKEELDKD